MGGEGIDSESIAVVFANWFGPIAPHVFWLFRLQTVRIPLTPRPPLPNHWFDLIVFDGRNLRD